MWQEAAALRDFNSAYVGSGSLADIRRARVDVCSTPESGRQSHAPPCPLRATSGHFSPGHLTKRWRPMTVKRAIAATARRIADVKNRPLGPAEPKSVVREEKTTFRVRRLDHIGERF